MTNDYQDDPRPQNPDMRTDEQMPLGDAAAHEPVFNIPFGILVFIAMIVAIQLLRDNVLNNDQDLVTILQFSFIPARFGPFSADLPYPMSTLWSPFSYAFLHGGWNHLLVNTLWMLAFGSAVAKRFGGMRFWIFTLGSAMAGAALHLVFHWNEFNPVIGASACVSAYMGAAARFAFVPGRLGRPDLMEAPALTLPQSLVNRSFLVFVGMWFGLNFLFGTGIVSMGGTEGSLIAWEAHVGGFIFGLFAFALFDPVSRA